MRILAWLGLGLVLLLGGVLLAADLIVTGMVNRDPWRSRIDQLADEAVGRDVAWGELGVGLFPPSLVIEEVAIAGATAEAPPFVESQRVELRLMLAPLLAGAVVIDSLSVHEASVRLILTDDGIELPSFGNDGNDGSDGSDGEPQVEGGGSGGEGMSVAIRAVELVDARLVFEDRTVSPPRGIELVDVDAQLEGSSLGAPFDVSVSIEPKGGGLALVRGSAGLDQSVDLTLELKEFPLLPFDPYLAAADELRGLLTGTGTIRGNVSAPETVAGVFEVADARLRFAETVVEGPLTLEIEHSGPWSAPTGTFRIDATRARASLADVYEKKPGRPASITGRLVTKDGVIGFDDVQLKIENAEASGSAEFGRRIHARLALAPVELDHWPSLLKPLSDFELSGRVSSQRWEIWSEPLEMKGRLGFDRVHVSGPEGRAFTVNGGVIAGGGAIRSEDFVIEAAEQKLPIEVAITDLAGDWRYTVHTSGRQMDTNVLLTKIAGNPDTLFGLLDLDGDFTGALAGEASFVRALGGTTRFQISPGKLKGVSILEATLKQLDKMRGSGPLQNLLFGGGGRSSAMSEYYKDDFIELSANLRLGGGEATTRDLRLLAEGYEFRMKGTIALEDLTLDAEGELQLGEELTQTIAKTFGVERIPLVEPIVIPIPRIRGTVTDPKPEPDFTYLVRLLTSNLPGVKGVQELLKGLDGVLQQQKRRP